MRRATLFLAWVVCSGASGAGCTAELGDPTRDAGAVDAGAVDAGAVDAGAVDAGAVDAGAVDAGAVDAAAADSSWVDADRNDARTPACDDGIRNGGETAVDCGGPCPVCPPAPTCTDGVRNGGETGVDCGGPTCPACPVLPTCTDGVRNGGETGVDCGGPTCPVCPTYDEVVLADGPVSYYQYIAVNTLYDVVGGRNGTTRGPVGARGFGTSPPTARDNAPNFTTASYITVSDSSAFSIPTTGTSTIELWLRPSSLTYAFDATVPASSRYVYALGKGHSATYEYGVRFYSSDAVATRANAISGYVWNTTGGLGSGATSIAGLDTTTSWTHFVITYTNFGLYGPDTVNNGYNAAAFPGTIRLWRNGVYIGFGYMSQFGVSPSNSTAPLEIGRRGSSDGALTFQGAVGKLAIYDHALSDARILRHYQTVYPD